MQKVSCCIKDRAISNSETAFDGLVSNRLNQVTFSSAWRPQKQAVPTLPDKPATRQIEYLLFLNRWIKLPVEIFESLQFPEHSGLDSSLDLSLVLLLQA